MNLLDDETVRYPLIGSIQNSVGMGFLGNQSLWSIANALGVRVIHATTAFGTAHPGFHGRTSWVTDPNELRKEVQFLVQQRPGLIIIGFLPRPGHVDAVADALRPFNGVVLLDPVIGDYNKGLYVSEETATAIRNKLLPLAQIITPNRFEAEVFIGGADRVQTPWAYLNAMFDLGPHSVIIKSFEKDAEKHRVRTLVTNGYSYHRISSPFYPRYPAHGAGDTFAASVGTFIALGASPFAATLLGSALTARAVANSSNYGGACVDPVAALAKWNPLGYHVDDDKAMRFAEKSSVENETLRSTADDIPRLKFSPPKHKIIYT
ncbi:MAG: bifunctional hydroxymethylpyrimidine kinase/phosphomethylpyrimidine kinase [Vulcanimicrobiaceae bacterium]